MKKKKAAKKKAISVLLSASLLVSQQVLVSAADSDSDLQAEEIFNTEDSQTQQERIEKTKRWIQKIQNRKPLHQKIRKN